jgi:DNA-3-methyladenine glycosylase
MTISTVFSPASTASAEAAAPLGAAFFARDVLLVARELIGATVLVDGVGGMIIEVEAYGPDDPAAHSFRGLTPRTAAMFGPGGHAYVYRSYGIHWCMNFVCAEPGIGHGVLIRALAPTHGIATMQARRGLDALNLLCSGPGRVCQALGVTLAHNGLPLDKPPFLVLPRQVEPEIIAGPRIGISRAAERPWRFGLAGSPHLSRPFKPAR